MATHQIITIHGLNVRSPDYALSLVDNLTPLLQGIDHKVTSLYLGDIFAKNLLVIENQLKVSSQYKDLRAAVERTWMGTFVGDMYQFDDWREELLNQVMEVKDDGPVHVVAHSWGCIFTVEDLLPVVDAITLTMHGCPLDLYRLNNLDTNLKGYEFNMPTDNFWHAMDFIGGPIAQCSNAVDHQITDAGPGSLLDIIDSIGSLAFITEAHRSGWSSKLMAQNIANKVIGIEKKLREANG